MPGPGRSSSNSSEAVIALDLGGTKLASALFTPEGKHLAKRTLPLEGRAGSDVGNLILSSVRRLQRAAEARNRKIIGIGICVPGIANPRSGRVWAPNIPGWDDYPLRAELRRAQGQPARVVVSSDREASMAGEMWQGAARGSRNAVFLAVGTGIGAGLLVDGRIVRGAQGIAGAIGWLALDRPFRSEYTACGCFESHASGEGIAKVARAMLAQQRTYRGPLRAAQHPTSHDVFAAYEQGDSLAAKVLDEATEFWALAAANLVSLLNPELVVFGGGLFGPAVVFLDAIRDEARRWAQPVAIEQVQFVASQLGPDAALYGAARLAMKNPR